ncbi:MAG: LytR C-terminal domain-containing protein [Rhodoluna sp.]
MAKKFPIDEFDSVTEAGGRHRVRRTAKIRIFEWLRLFVVAIVIAGLGYGGLKLIESTSVFDGYLPSSNSTPSPTSSAGIAVTVLDGGGKNLAGQAGQLLADAGFTITKASKLVDASKQPVAIDTTVVVIVDEIFRDEGNTLAMKLKMATTPAVIVSPEFEGPVTLVLGKDYKVTKK